MFYSNLMESISEAEIMYKFSRENLCTNLQDITLMCEQLDFEKIVMKPEYQGDMKDDAALEESKLAILETKRPKYLSPSF